jgi:FkbM family methyltransferase
MIFDFIEIGTSDFDTLISTTENKIGLSIEPLKYYLDNLPNNRSVIKLNAAITDFDGYVDIFWIDHDDIVKYDLPLWLRGCNSIIEPHKSGVKELEERNLLNLMKSDKCTCISWDTLINRYNINGVEFLKIDTEGHDCKILMNIIESKTKILPKKIKFESNILTDEFELKNTLISLLKLGYKIKERTLDDFIIEL